MAEASTKGDTASRILTAADELLGEVGYDGTSVRDVARRAGVNKALVFYHFTNKAELFKNVLERYYAAHLEVLESAFDGQGEVRARLHRVADAYLDFIVDNQRYPRLIQQMVSGGDASHELVERNLVPFFERVTRLLSAVCPSHGPTAARHFYITFSGMVLNYFTYAPILSKAWGIGPMTDEGLAERRAHIHWVVDTIFDKLSETEE